MSQYLQRHQHLKDASNSIIREFEDMSGLSADILTKVVIETIDKYQQKINVGIQDSVSDLLDNFKIKITNAIIESSLKWRIANRDYALFPRGCRFAYSKGNQTVFILEQEPQIRSLLFKKSLIQPDSSNPNGSERVALALPYVIFIVHLSGGKFSNLYSGWRNSPLCSIKDFICRPILPNIYDNLAVCTGVLNLSPDISEPNRLCSEIVNNFWNTQFNGDLAQHWDTRAKIDPRLKSVRVWEQESKKDSSFILGVKQKEEKSINHFIDLLTRHENEPDETQLRHSLTESIDSCVNHLFYKILRYFKNTKFEKHHPKEIKEILVKIMTKAGSEFADMVFAIQKEIEKLEKDVNQTLDHVKFEKRGSFWSDYNP
jgi:hypothetical protein